MPIRLSATSRFLILVGLVMFLAGAVAPKPARANNPVSGTIVGMVRDKVDKKPIGRASVRVVNDLNGHVRSAVTDARGEYRLPFLPEGTYSLKATSPNYLPEELPKFLVQFGQYNRVIDRYFRLDVIELRRTTLNGIVLDGANQVLSASRVEVINQKAGVWRMATTDQNGGYEIAYLPPGRYVVKASWSGAGGESGPSVSDSDTSIMVTLDREVVTAPPIKIPAAINSVGNPAASTPVSGAQSSSSVSLQATPRRATEGEKGFALILALDAARGDHFGKRQLDALPLGGANFTRSFDELALLVAGVAPPPFTPGARGPGVGFGVGTAGQFSVNGLRARSNNFSVDGSDNNDADVGVRRQGFVALTPQSIESVQGVFISTLLWDAELGRNSGAQVNAVSKYGENQFHGQAYGFFTDSSLNARNFFDYTGGVSGGQDPFTRTQLGGVIGGPIVKDRTHFLASFEHDRINASTEQHFSTPTIGERRFRDLTTLGFADPDAFGSFAFGAVQTFRQTTPLGSNILSPAFYPLPNNTSGPFGANTFTQILPADGDGNIASFRLTQQFKGDHLLNARYNFTNDQRVLPSVNRAIRSTIDSRTRSHNLSLIMDSAAGPMRFNQARVSFGRTRLRFDERPDSRFIFESSSTANIQVGQNNFPFTAQTGPIGELLIEPFSPVGIGVNYFPQARASNTFQFADAFSWVIGSHALKFGGNVRRYQLNSRLDRLYRPQVVYGGGLVSVGEVFQDTTGNSCPRNPDGSISSACFRPRSSPVATISGVELAGLGVASGVLQTITTGVPDSTIGLRFNEYHIFINDNWRVRPNFRLDYGLRYEYSSVPHSVGKRIEQSLVLNNVPAPGNSRFNTAARTQTFNAAVSAYRRILDGRNRIYDQDRNNFGPHAGFAWDPFAKYERHAGKTAVRGGYGIYYDAILGSVVTQSRNVFPNEIPVSVDPSFLQFDAYSLNNPAVLRVVRDGQGNFTNPVDLLRPGACNQFGRCNQIGGTPDDFVALVGLLFQQNQKGGLAFTLPEKRLRTPYAQHWHLTAERVIFDDYFFSAAYVGTKGTKLTRLMTPNLGAVVTPFVTLTTQSTDVQANQVTAYPSPVIFNQFVGSGFASRPTGDLGAYQVYENSASSTYHALQLEAHKRYDYGFLFTAAYTWSHALDDVSDIFTVAGAPILPQDTRNLRSERASASFDVRHRFAASAVWDLPFHEDGGKVTKILLDGWQIASIFQAQTGQPFTLTLPFDNNFDGNLSDRPATSQGLMKINEHGVRRIALASNRSFQDYLNFTVNGLSVTPGRGVVGRNTVRGDGFVNLDFSLNKQFRFAERHLLEFRAEFFNLLNRANFGLPIHVIGAPGFGSAVETVHPARIVQFALKYSF